MKTISHNSTTSSVSVTAASGNDQPQLVATIVPDEQRISFWAAAFLASFHSGWPWSPVFSAGWTVCAKTTAVVSGICTP
ncbi:anti-restriction protein [Escherichia coli]|nr:anti-restriction protein [Escherichia coli]